MSRGPLFTALAGGSFEDSSTPANPANLLIEDGAAAAGAPSTPANPANQSGAAPPISTLAGLAGAPNSKNPFGSVGAPLLDLETRIRQMAARWQYTTDDLAYALDDARARPDAWAAICQHDEQHHDLCWRAGVTPASGCPAPTTTDPFDAIELPAQRHPSPPPREVSP